MQLQPTPAEEILRAAGLLSAHTWTRKALARDENDTPCKVASREACKWDIAGALIAVRPELLGEVESTFIELFGSSVFHFNDVVARDYRAAQRALETLARRFQRQEKRRPTK